MPCRNLVLGAFAALAIGSGPAARADTITFTDPATFSTSIWSKTVLGGGSVDVARETSDGNPGDFLKVHTSPLGDSSNIVVGVFLNWAAKWNPSTQGAITNLTMYIDKKAIDAFGGGQAIRIALMQDGKIFDDPFALTSTPVCWTIPDATDFCPDPNSSVLRSDSLVVLNQSYFSFGAVDRNGFTDRSIRPDFSTNGSVITFGFDVGNTGGTDASGTTIGYDNWNLSFQVPEPLSTPQMPEPGSLALFGFGLAGLGWTRRCRQRG